MTRVQKVRLPVHNDRRNRHPDITYEALLAAFPWKVGTPPDAEVLLREAIDAVRKVTERRVIEHGSRRAQKLRQEIVDLQSLAGSFVRGVAALPGNRADNGEKLAAAIVELEQLASSELMTAVRQSAAIVSTQQAALNEIAATAGLLEDQLRAFRSRFRSDPPKTKADVRKHEFVRAAAGVWDQLAANPPSTRRDGLFAKFCAMAWLDCGYEAPAKDTLSSIGAVVERVLKSRRM